MWVKIIEEHWQASKLIPMTSVDVKNMYGHTTTAYAVPRYRNQDNIWSRSSSAVPTMLLCKDISTETWQVYKLSLVLKYTATNILLPSSERTGSWHGSVNAQLADKNCISDICSSRWLTDTGSFKVPLCHLALSRPAQPQTIKLFIPVPDGSRRHPRLSGSHVPDWNLSIKCQADLLHPFRNIPESPSFPSFVICNI